VAAPVSLKRKKVDKGPSKQVEQSSSRLPIRDAVPLVKAVPLVIMVDVDPSLTADPSEVRDATINQTLHVTMSKAKSVVS
jgi:exosome complex RNA-binding protein Rrp42 (RNase PH superfamily)